MAKDEALKMAIECLEYHFEQGAWGCNIEGTIQICKETLDQPAQDCFDWNPRDINFDDDIIVDNYEIKFYNELDEYPDNSKDR